MWMFILGYAAGMVTSGGLLVALWLWEAAAERRERVQEDGRYG